MIGKKADHTVHPGKDHRKWTTKPAVQQAALDKCGFKLYLNAEALPELWNKAMGPQEDDATFQAATVASTSKAAIKEAEAVMDERARAEGSDEEMWDRDRVSNLEKQWALEIEREADAERQKTMRIPSSVSAPHVATGAAVKGTKLIGKRDLVGSGSAKRPTPSRPKKRNAVEVAEGDAAATEEAEGSTRKKARKVKKPKEPSS